MRLTYELEPEDGDGRWVAEILELPGVLAYGDTAEAALDAVRALAFRVIAERIEHGDLAGKVDGVEFVKAA